MRRIFYSFLILSSLILTQCTSRIIKINCNSTIPLLARIDSFSVTHQFYPENFPFSNISGNQKDLILYINVNAKLKDSNQFPNFCSVLKFQDTVQEIKIFNTKSLGPLLPANTDISAYFRKIDLNFSPVKPYYTSIPKYIHQLNSGVVAFQELSHQNFIIADSMPIEKMATSSFKFVFIKRRENINTIQEITTPEFKFYQ